MGAKGSPSPLFCAPSATATKPLLPHPMIYDYQKPAFEKLLSVAKACFAVQRQTLSIRVRTNTMIVGPSGAGKTHLARAVAEKCETEFLSVTLGEWIPLGCSGRGGVPTWPVIAKFLLRNRKAAGLVIFVDEIDKVSGTSTWETFLRTEVFSLLDFKIPIGINDDDLDCAEDLPQAQEALSNRTLILGAGAFQHIWENRGRASLGFGEPDSNGETIDLTLLAATLPRELTNRFRSDLVILPELLESDYRRILLQSAEGVPVYLRETFLRLGHLRIPSAVACRQGCRFLEELMLDTIIEEKSLLHLGDKPRLINDATCPCDPSFSSPDPLLLPAPSTEPDA